MSTTNHLGQPIGDPVDLSTPAPVPSNDPMTGRFCDLVALDASTHSADLFAAYSQAPDDGDWTYLSTGPFESEDGFGDWVASVQDLNDPIFFAIIDRRTDRAAGVASYLRIAPQARSIEVGSIHFSRQLQKTPVATEAMYLMMQRAFELGYRRYEWKCDSLNGPSRAAASRFGFTYEGEFRQALHYKGRNRNTAWFSIIDSEWPAISAAFEGWLAPENFDAAGGQLARLQDLRASG